MNHTIGPSRKSPTGGIIGRLETRRPGFTLLELVIVMLVMSILVAIAIPVTRSVLNRSNVSGTQATLQVVELAIQEYKRANPLAKDPLMPCESASCEPNDPNKAFMCQYPGLFGKFPPSPLAALDVSDSAVAACRVTLPETQETADKATRLLEYLQADPLPAGSSTVNTNYLSVETLVLFMRVLSPGAKDILDDLPDNLLTNQDRDTIEYSGEAIDLSEIVDAWGRPIRYFIKPTSTGDFRWELRSAGPDGEFAAMLSDEQVSDDVIVKGP